MVIPHKILLLIASGLLVSSSVSHAISTVEKKALRPIQEPNRWYIVGTNLANSLILSDTLDLNHFITDIGHFAPLIFDKPSSPSSKRAFKALQKVACGMKDRFIKLSSSHETSNRLYQQLEPLLSIIITAPNYAFTCRAVGTYIAQWANSPEAAALLDQVRQEAQRYEHTLTQHPTESYFLGKTFRARNLGKILERLLTRTCDSNSITKIFRSDNPNSLKEQLVLMHKHGDFKDISLVAEGIKRGLTSRFIIEKDIVPIHRSPQTTLVNPDDLTYRFTIEIVSLLCEGTIDLLKGGTGTIHLQKIGEHLANYGKAVSKNETAELPVRRSEVPTANFLLLTNRKT